jgi:hypothetical protein
LSLLNSSPLIALAKIGCFDLLMLSNPQMTDKSRLMQRVNVVWLVLNVLGAIVYLVRASLSWAIPEEHGLIPITGEPYIWFVAVVPILAVFLLLNLTWGAMILGHRQWRSGRLWFLAAVIWLARNCHRFRAPLNPKRPRQSTPISDRLHPA